VSKVKTRHCVTCRYHRDEFVFSGTRYARRISERYHYCERTGKRLVGANVECDKYQANA
jgi:hypothetical protein